MSFEIELNRQLGTGNILTKFLTNLKKLDSEELTPALLRSRQKLLEEYWSSFETRHQVLKKESEFWDSEYAMSNVYAQVKEDYQEARAFLLELIKDNSSSFRRIRLPTFSGDDLAWEDFRHSFTTQVHKAFTLSNTTRLYHLKKSLSGEAAKILSGFRYGDSNYAEAWKALVDRFDSERQRMSFHFNRFLSLKPMNTVTAHDLQALLDTTKETRTELMNLDRPVKHWDDWFVYVMVQKLDSSLRKDWETHLGDRNYIPTFTDLTNFLKDILVNLQRTEAL